MPRTRPPYPPEFRQEAVRLARESGKPSVPDRQGSRRLLRVAAMREARLEGAHRRRILLEPDKGCVRRRWRRRSAVPSHYWRARSIQTATSTKTANCKPVATTSACANHPRGQPASHGSHRAVSCGIVQPDGTCRMQCWTGTRRRNPATPSTTYPAIRNQRFVTRASFGTSRVRLSLSPLDAEVESGLRPSAL